MAGKGKSNVIKLSRVYDAPVKAVWDAWHEPDQVAQWWGPRGFTLTTHSKELKPGGVWHYTMHGPDGTDYVNKTLYHEVEKHSKLVYDHGGNDEQAPLFRVTALFQEVKGRTHLELCFGFATPEVAAEMGKFIKKVGGESTWDRLGEFLGKRLRGKECFVINRSFETGIEHLFELWTDPKHYTQWLPPAGFTMEFIRADIRSGGSSFYKMSNGQGLTMYGRARYQEVRRPDRLVYEQEFCDEHEKLSRHPMAPTWPATMRTTVTLTAEGPTQTRVTVLWEVVGEATAEEMATFIHGRAGMTQGWTGSFDKLEVCCKS
ncbi:MAG: SRPBCC domain-containing protein [Bdellovibrionales bacterium]|nr:SRPBCC domain-containing protein [Bdellovibrionales bacterium]